MFLLDLPLEDKWEHPKLRGLEINMRKARKMGNVIKRIVCTASELQKKRAIFLPLVKLADSSIRNSNYVSQPLF